MDDDEQILLRKEEVSDEFPQEWQPALQDLAIPGEDNAPRLFFFDKITDINQNDAWKDVSQYHQAGWACDVNDAPAAGR